MNVVWAFCENQFYSHFFHPSSAFFNTPLWTEKPTVFNSFSFFFHKFHSSTVLY